MSVWTIVVAAGAGRRYGATKQFEPFGDGTVVDHAVRAARSVSDGVVVVVPTGMHREAVHADAVVDGGATRSASVRAGLAAVPEGVDVIVVHDAVRPLASAGLFHAVVEAVRAGADGAIPGLPVADTLKRVVDGRVASTIDRSDLVAVQTPQAFAAAVLRAAHDSGADATDDAVLVEAAGGRVVVVPGETTNLKITTADDLRVAGALVVAPMNGDL